MDAIRQNGEMEERVNILLRSNKSRSIEEVLEEVEVLIGVHFFNEFSRTKSSAFLKRIITGQNTIEINIPKKTWRTLNCTPKTPKVIREIQENLPCVGKRRELITEQKDDSRCWCSKTGLQLNAKHVVSCCKKVSADINARHDIMVNIILNNTLKQRGLVTHEQRWEDRKTVRTAHDEITVGTEHCRSDEWKENGRVSGARLNPDLVLLRCDAGQWRKVVVDVRITSTDKMNEAFKERGLQGLGVHNYGDPREEGFKCGDGSPHHLPRWSCPP